MKARVAYAFSSPLRPVLYLLSIGIDDYENSTYRLAYSVADAEAFSSAIAAKASRLFERVEVKGLRDGQATKSGVMLALGAIAAAARPEDVLVIFYAGHGIALDVPSGDSEFYYVLHGVTQMTSLERCSTQGVSASEMRTALAAIRAKKQVMFVDACNSGAFASRFTARGAAEETALAKLGRATGVVIVASTTKDQAAVEARELGHGLFTYVLLEAVTEPGKGEITARGLALRVEELLPVLTAKYRGIRQYPVTFSIGQDFPLGFHTEGGGR